MNQKDTNPFPYSESNKRYYTYDYYMKKRYGGKCVKIPLDAGLSCPNIDGKCGVGGCIYCSGRGSGDFAASPALPLSEQYRITRSKLTSKWDTSRCIAYFQAHTNTYAPLDVLKRNFGEAARFDGVVGLSIATRADCLPSDVISYLNELSAVTDVTVELGLQTSNDNTAKLINRGHTFEAFKDGFYRLREGAKKVSICVHLIFGLPGESHEIMMKSVRDVAALHPDQVKLHLMHVIKGTALAAMYESGHYAPLGRSEYIDLVCRALTFLPEDVVICRLTGDGMEKTLLAPDWSRKKVTILNDIDKKMYENDLWQGKNISVM